MNLKSSWACLLVWITRKEKIGPLVLQVYASLQ